MILTEDKLKMLGNTSTGKNVSERMQSSINFDIKREDGEVPISQEQQEEEFKETLAYCLQVAHDEAQKYNFKLACDWYKKALTFNKDENYINELPVIYTKMAYAYHKLNEIDNSLKYYNLAREFYNQIGEVVKENYIKLNIANVYYETYKFDLAKNTLLEIIATKDNPHILTTKAYIALANIEDSLSNGVKFYFNKLDLKKKIRPVNRLDKDTSGLVIFAKNEYVQESLVKQMKNKEFIKFSIKEVNNKLNNRKPNSILGKHIMYLEDYEKSYFHA